MARFDRQSSEASSIPKSLDVATGELESFVEHRVREIIDAAVERAAQIEREAAESAQEVKRKAERKSEEMLEEAFTRAWRILDGIDLLENGVGDMIGALRTEMEGFAADIGSAVPADDRPSLDSPSSADDGPRPQENEPKLRALPQFGERENGAGSTHGTSPIADAPASAPGTQRFAEPDGSHAEVEQMIMEQVAILFREGRSRADAERFVMRFKQGEDYLHVLDRIYRVDGEGPPPPQLPSSPPQRIRWGFRERRG